jgi:hypothetical protein
MEDRSMLELGVGADLFRMAGGVVWLVVIGVFVAALLIPKMRKSKAIAIAVVTVLFAAFPGRWFWEMKSEADAQKARLAKAEAMFQERCKKAGEFIHRSVDDVDGILLMKVRLKEASHGDQFEMDDPYGRDMWGDGYIKSFLRGNETRQAEFPPDTPQRYGYHYVEVIDPEDGKRYRFTGAQKVVGGMDVNAPNVQVELKRNPEFDLNIYDFVVEKAPSPGPSPRYGVTYDDISTREEREYWIAGSSLRIVDLQTNEVIAERIGYMMDRGQGALGTGGSQRAWLRAANNACPGFQRSPNRPIPPGRAVSAQSYQTEDFVEKILKPKLEN